MRRFVFLTVLALVLALSGSALGVVAYSASWQGQTNSGTGTGGTIQNVEIQVTCPAGETFLGRVSVRAGGQTFFTGRIHGTCTGSPIVVETNQERTREIPCFTQYTLGGQVRFSSGVKASIPKIKDEFCNN